MSGCKMLKFAFSGAHNSGKTTALWYVATELKQHGVKRFNVVPEVARFCPYPIGKRAKFTSQLWMMLKQMELEAHTSTFHKMLLCDRSVFDSLAYSYYAAEKKLISTKELELLTEIAESWGKFHPYKVIFHFEPLPEDSDPKFQRDIHRRLTEILPACASVQTAIYYIKGNRKERCEKVFKLICGALDHA